MKRFALAAAFAAALAAPAAGARESYAERPDVQAFIGDMVERHGFVPSELRWLFSRVRRVEPALQAIEPPSAERPRSWQDYRAMFVNERRVAAGLRFWSAHRRTLERAQAQYGVPASVVLGILGVETFYGRNTGRFRVVDALTTLAFDYPPRAEFFRSELANYLLFARDTGADVFAARGSYAGAIGIPQFMPGSILRYGVDFDRNGAIDLQGSAADAIGSVANFLKEHGWQRGGEISRPATLSGDAWRPYLAAIEPSVPLAELMRAGVQPQPPLDPQLRAALVELETPGGPSEYRIGLQNFYVLTRYNRSTFYAAAVSDLAAALERGRKSAAQEPGR
ncbi:MAG TPA: lytic murein transglycosylase B [Burkholderiales bacterium]|nr:lytic murein transglycosylase B [Burkholderiales bacterium]